MDAALAVQDLTLAIDNATIVDGVTFTVHPARCWPWWANPAAANR